MATARKKTNQFNRHQILSLYLPLRKARLSVR